MVLLEIAAAGCMNIVANNMDNKKSMACNKKDKYTEVVQMDHCKRTNTSRRSWRM